MWPYLQVLVPLCTVALASALCIGVVSFIFRALKASGITTEDDESTSWCPRLLAFSRTTSGRERSAPRWLSSITHPARQAR
jgi:hypothetical protein